MATVVIKTVKPSGGDYTSLAAAEAGEQRDLVAVDQVCEIDCYTMTETTTVAFAGWNTDATHYIRVYVPRTERHNGTRGTGYHFVFSSGNTWALNIQQNHVRLEGVSINYPNGAAIGVNVPTPAATDDIRISDCLLYSSYFGVQGTAGQNVVCMNNVSYGCRYDVIGQGAFMWVYNCTSLNNVGGTAFYSQVAGTVTVKNCYAGGPGGGTIFGNTSVTNASYDGRSGSLVVPSSLKTVINNKVGAEDAHLPAESALRGVGTDLSADTYWRHPDGTVDVDGNPRPAGAWSIGADQGATVVTKKVGPSNMTPDYTSLSAWEAAMQADLVATDTISQAECYSFADTTTCGIGGWTTDAVHYVRVYTPSSQRHDGRRRPDKYKLYPSSPFGAALTVSQAYTRIEGLQVSNSYSSSTNSPQGIVVSGGAGIRISDTLIYDIAPGINSSSHAFYNQNGSTCYLDNCIAMNCGGRGFSTEYGSGSSTLYAYNCTVVNCGYGFYARSLCYSYFTNCYAGGNTTAQFYKDASPNAFVITTCASSDGATVGTYTPTAAACSTTTGAMFANVTAGSEDVFPQSGSALRGLGTNLATDANWFEPAGAVDVIGAARPATGAWDVGAVHGTPWRMKHTATGNKVSSVAVGAPIPAGHDVYLVISCGAEGNPTTITDSKGQSYTKLLSYTSGGSWGQSIWRKTGTVALAATDTVTSDTANKVIQVFDVTGLSSAAPTATGNATFVTGTQKPVVTSGAGAGATDAVIGSFFYDNPNAGGVQKGGSPIWADEFTSSNYENTETVWGQATAAGAQSVSADWGQAAAPNGGLVITVPLAPSGPATLASGRIASSAALRGGVVTGEFNAILYSGRVASAMALRGGTATGVGAVAVASGRIASAAAVRGGALRGLLARVLSGRIASGAGVRGGTIRTLAGIILSGRIASAQAVRGGTQAGTGTGALRSGRIASAQAVRGGTRVHGVGAALIASGRIASAAVVRGGQEIAGKALILSGRIASSAAMRGGWPIIGAPAKYGFAVVKATASAAARLTSRQDKADVTAREL